MKRHHFFSILFILAAVVLLPGPVRAAQVIVSFTGSPTTFPPGVLTTVSLMTVLNDPSLKLVNANLQRQQADGSWKTVDKLTFTPGERPGEFVSKASFKENATDAFLLRYQSTIGTKVKHTSPVLQISVGDVVGPSPQDVTVQGPDGSGMSVTVSGGSLTTSAFVGIAPVPPDVFPVPEGEHPRVATLIIIFRPTQPVDGVVLKAPLKISVPAPPGTPADAHFLFVQPVRGPALGNARGLETKLFARDIGVVANGKIVSQGTSLPGVSGDAMLGVLRVSSATVSGKVCDASVTTCDASATPAPGVWVQEKPTSTDTDNIGTYTDARGNYTVFVDTYIDNSVVKFDLVAEDGLRCARIPEANPQTGEVGGAVDTTNPPDEIVDVTGVNFKVSRDPSLPLSTPGLPKFYGVRNGGFEVGLGFINQPSGPEPCWTSSGTVTLLKELFDQGNFDKTVVAATGANLRYRDLFGFNSTLRASEGQAFVAIRSNDGTISQAFMVPKSRKMLHFDFNFACEAGTATCDAFTTTFASGDNRLDDMLQVELELPSGSTIPPISTTFNPGCTIAATTVTCSHQFSTFGGQLGWRPGKLDLTGVKVLKGGSPVDLDGSGVPVTLRFTARNLGTCTVCAVLIDNVRFNTVFISANIVKRVNRQAGDPPDPTRAYVETQVRHANELISQAGANVRLRQVIEDLAIVGATCFASTPSPGIFDSTDVTPTSATCDVDKTSCTMTTGIQKDTKILPTPEVSSLVCLGARGLPNSDIEIDYVPELTNTQVAGEVFGVAITREDNWRTDAMGDAIGNIIANVERGYDFVSSYNTNEFLTLKNQTAIFIKHFRIDGSNSLHEDRFRDTLAHELGHHLISSAPLVSGQEQWWLRPKAELFNLEHNISSVVDTFIQPNVMDDDLSTQRILFTGEDTFYTDPDTLVTTVFEAQVGRWDEPENQPGPRCENVGCPH